MTPIIAEITEFDVIVFGVSLLAAFCLIVAACFIGVWIRRNQSSVSPYSGIMLRRTEDLPYESKVKILRYLYELHQYDNRLFTFKNAAICRETGRIFSDCVTWLGTIKVVWSFLQKRYPGTYVSWGSLTDLQKQLLRDAHYSLDGFQTEFSSTNPSPRAIEPQYAFAKPGPLYVDLNTHVLLGWKIVPDTEFELLIVQFPKDKFRSY